MTFESGEPCSSSCRACSNRISRSTARGVTEKTQELALQCSPPPDIPDMSARSAKLQSCPTFARIASSRAGRRAAAEERLRHHGNMQSFNHSGSTDLEQFEAAASQWPIFSKFFVLRSQDAAGVRNRLRTVWRKTQAGLRHKPSLSQSLSATVGSSRSHHRPL